jgi:phosphoglycerol transferase MdoB-like AlkP superfamily enzyme
LIHIKNLLEYFSQKIDAKEWNKILIVGDHTPPFPTAQERNFYVDGKVPYLLITKK